MRILSLALVPVLACSCATLNESMTLGAGLGALSGTAATAVAQSTSDRSAPGENVLLGAGIGLGVGLIASYFTHKSVETTRAACMADETEMHFGDLPPSPFIFPKTLPKKEGRR
jgi:hypothetical protein